RNGSLNIRTVFPRPRFLRRPNQEGAPGPSERLAAERTSLPRQQTLPSLHSPPFLVPFVLLKTCRFHWSIGVAASAPPASRNRAMFDSPRSRSRGPRPGKRKPHLPTFEQLEDRCVPNSMPIITNPGTQYATEGTSFSLQLTASA